MAKRITFDSEIIETLYTSLRQFSSDRLEGVGRMAYSDLDDVDYLVEDNVWMNLLITGNGRDPW